MRSWGKAVMVGTIAFVASGASVAAQGMDWNSLPEPHHLREVLDVNTFLGGAAAPSGQRYVQVGAFRLRENAASVAERVNATGLDAQLGRQGSWFLVLMPETDRNTAEVLAGWARRSGFPDAYIREIR